MGAFDGKVALVTGGSSGLGRATAVAFAREGAAVLVAARRRGQGEETVEQAKAIGIEACFVQTDVANRDEIECMVSHCIRRFGRLDYAFNNAGIEGSVGVSVADYEEEVWDRVMAINLKGVWLCMKYQIPEMLGLGGAIVNMSSVAGLKGASIVGAAYSASKHGVIGLTKSAALEYATKGIRINAVCPAVIETDMAERAFNTDPEVYEQAKLCQPIGRMGTSDEVAEAVVWLCSDAASFMTGVAMPVDGGYMA